MYFFALTTLLPAAIITSVSTYRLKLHLRHGIAPPSTGCSRCGHAAALALATLGAVITLAVMGAALNLVGPTVTAFINTLSPGAASIGGNFIPTIAGMPGLTLAILAMLCAVLAAALLLSTLCCTGLTALPGFGVQCRVVCDEAGQQQQQQRAAAAPTAMQYTSAADWSAPAYAKEGAPAAPQFLAGQEQLPPPPPPPGQPPLAVPQYAPQQIGR